MRKQLQYIQNQFFTPQTGTVSGYLPALTGIRALAAYMVFLQHYCPFAPDEVPPLVYRFFKELHVGVPLFFVLSGFLICLRYANNFEFSSKWFIRYMQNRVARIYPIYFILTTITFLYYFAINGYFETGVYIANITFLRGFFDEIRFSGIMPGWSLTVEETFYFLAPFIFLLSKRFKLFWQPLFILAFGLAMIVVSKKLHFDYLGFFGSIKGTFLYTFFGRCFEFYVGIQLALWYRLYLQGKNTPLSIFSKWSQKMPFFTIFGIIAFVVCIFLLDVIGGFIGNMELYPRILVNNFILPMGILLLYWGILTEKTHFSRFLEKPIMQLLGKSSYAFYLIHFSVVSVFVTDVITFHNTILTFIVLNIISIAVYKYIEEPLNERIRKIKFSTNKTTVSQLAN